MTSVVTIHSSPVPIGHMPCQPLRDLAARRVFAADDDVAYVSERDDVQSAAVGLWRSEHAFGVDALAEVEAAAAAAAQAKLRLAAAVALAGTPAPAGRTSAARPG